MALNQINTATEVESASNNNFFTEVEYRRHDILPPVEGLVEIVKKREKESPVARLQFYQQIDYERVLSSFAVDGRIARNNNDQRVVLGSGGSGIVYLLKRIGGINKVLKVSKKRYLESEFDVLCKAYACGMHVPLPISNDTREVFDLTEMGLVSGPTLKRYMQQNVLSIDDALLIALALAVELNKFHTAGYVFKDVKPSNVIINVANGSNCSSSLSAYHSASHVTVIDFGIASKKHLTIPSLVGTRGYLAPEAVLGAADPRMDIYGLGVVLVEMIIGYNPFKHHIGIGRFMSSYITSIKNYKQLQDVSSLNNDLNKEYMSSSRKNAIQKAYRALEQDVRLNDVGELVDAMLAYHPKDRLQTCEEVIERINRFNVNK